MSEARQFEYKYVKPTNAGQYVQLIIKAENEKLATEIADRIVAVQLKEEYSVELKTTEVSRPSYVIEAFNLEEAQNEAAEKYEIDPDSSMAQTGQGEYKYTEIVNVALIE